MGTLLKEESVKFHWSSEVYSLGKTFRAYYKLPKWLPLPFYSDHAPLQSGIIDFAILENAEGNALYLTFSNTCIERNSHSSQLNIIGTLHPWIPYKRKTFKSPKNHSSKIIFFPLHMTPEYITEGTDDVDSISILRQLEETGLSVKICLHWHDVGSDREQIFREEGFETFTLGDPYNSEFVDNFYKNTLDAKFVVTESYTSAIPYLIEAGVPCSILPRNLSIRHKDRQDQNFGTADEFARKDLEEVERIFEQLPPEIDDAQIKFVKRELGFEFEDNYEEIRKTILKSYLRQLPKWYIKQSRKALNISRLLRILKKKCEKHND